MTRRPKLSNIPAVLFVISRYLVCFVIVLCTSCFLLHLAGGSKPRGPAQACLWATRKGNYWLIIVFDCIVHHSFSLTTKSCNFSPQIRAFLVCQLHHAVHIQAETVIRFHSRTSIEIRCDCWQVKPSPGDALAKNAQVCGNLRIMT